MKIEKGDRVRIVAAPARWNPEWGTVGDVGTVLGIGAVSCWVEVDEKHAHGCGWSHPLANLALFADEPEDMEPGTVFTRSFGNFACGPAVFCDVHDMKAAYNVTDDEIRRLAGVKP